MANLGPYQDWLLIQIRKCVDTGEPPVFSRIGWVLDIWRNASEPLRKSEGPRKARPFGRRSRHGPDILSGRRSYFAKRR